MFSLSLEKPSNQSLFSYHLHWDLIVIGGGPAGLNAALYAKRKGLNVGIVSKDLGGQLHNTSEVDNYLGFTLISAKDLIANFIKHIESLEVPLLSGVTVEKVTQHHFDYEILLSNGKTLLTKTILIATGGKPRQLGVKGEMEFANKGVSYCTTCDAPFFKGKHVIVAGGGNSAAEAVLDLVPWAKKITVIHRSNWRADDIILEKLKHVSNLEVHLNTQILEIIGQDKMSGVKVFDKIHQIEKNIEADGIFIEIGNVPKSELFKELILLNDHQEIIVDQNQRTSKNGIYAAGDITNQPHKQIIISAAEGAKAALDINYYLQHEYKGEKL